VLGQLLGMEIQASAVENQIAWGITMQHDIRNQSHARNVILNKSAALEVGFISSSDLPKYMFIR